MLRDAYVGTDAAGVLTKAARAFRSASQLDGFESRPHPF